MSRVSNPSKPAGMKLTYDDFVLFPDDGKRHELIDGEHYLTPSPNLRHQRISGNLYLLIASWLEEHPVGKVFYAPLDIVLSDYDVVEPDLIYFSNERAADIAVPQHLPPQTAWVSVVRGSKTRWARSAAHLG